MGELLIKRHQLGVANREFFYILREMTKLKIFGCGAAPSGGWSGLLVILGRRVGWAPDT